jgi:hypothetical protein
MIKLSNILKEIEVGMGSSPRIYVSRINKDLFKIENFPILQDKRRIATRGFLSARKKLDPQFWRILDKIRDYSQEDIEQSPDIGFSGEFLSSGNSYIIKEDPGVFTIIQDWEYLGKNEDWDSRQDWEEI